MSRRNARTEKALEDFRAAPQPLLLDAGVQYYAWGDPTFIPELLGVDHPDGRPFAELWMGTHATQPSRALVGGTWVSLRELIQGAPEKALGPSAARRFGGELPFLFKVIAAAVPLSLQVHPDRQRAEEGFARENAEGIPLSAGQRNYKDPHHKPELLVALTDFYALRGFRPLDEIAESLGAVPELAEWIGPVPTNASELKTLYARFMRLAQEEVDHLLDPLVRRLEREDETGNFTRADREYWLLRADRMFLREGRRDRGLFSLYLLNLVHLAPGEGLYLRPGVVHSYLEGAGVEIMANSDNVLRGGLTAKHVDVEELLANVDVVAGPAEILRAKRLADGQEWVYRTPAREFELHRVNITRQKAFAGNERHGAEILLGVDAEGERPAVLSWPTGSFELRKGRACFVPYGVAYSIAVAGSSTFYKAMVPSD